MDFQELRQWLEIWGILEIDQLKDNELPVLPTFVLDTNASSDLDGTLYIFPLIFHTKLKPFRDCCPF